MLPRTPQNRTRIEVFNIHRARKFTLQVLLGMNNNVERDARDHYLAGFAAALRNACIAWSAAATPVIQPPCAVEKSPREQASPAKNRRLSTGAASVARQSAMPGSAYEYEPRANGSAPQQCI